MATAVANGLPIPLPPRTPTPPTPGEMDMSAGMSLNDRTNSLYSPDTLSPLRESFSGPSASLSAQYASRSPLSPRGFTPPYTPHLPGSETGTVSLNGAENMKGPFSFQPQQYIVGKPPPGKDIGRRRGHKYKHSSVSHQIFVEPAPRTPLQIPTSLPIPTFSEFRQSMSREQKKRGLWCCCHLFVAACVQWSAHGSLAMTALSHLLFFDALGAFLCVAVDIGGNFEVWKRSSISHPFGLERTEVLCGLAMAVGLLFMGLDLISHGLKDSLESVGTHEPHHIDPHAHEAHRPGSVNWSSLLAIIATVISAFMLSNHARIGRVMRMTSLFKSLPHPLNILNNPTHLLTISCSVLTLVLPLLEVELHAGTSLDAALSFLIAFAMIYLGARLCATLGRMLLMSYPTTSRGELNDVVQIIQQDGSVAKVDDVRVWQVHYGLCMANLRIRVREKDVSAVQRLRGRIEQIVRSRLGGGYGAGLGGVRWEVSTECVMSGD